METTTMETAYNNTFPNSKVYYRDCNLKKELISKYTIGQILMERGFTDMSSIADGLALNFRYVIASNNASNMGQINPKLAKYGFHVLPSSSYYKVLDIYKIGSKTQIILLNFNVKYIKTFSSYSSNIEQEIVEKIRHKFNTKVNAIPNELLSQKEWVDRTRFPIGMSDSGELFHNERKESESKQAINKEIKKASIPKVKSKKLKMSGTYLKQSVFKLIELLLKLISK